MKSALIENIIRLHTTEMGAERITQNLGLTEDPVEWCRSKILDKNAIIERRGKNWYVSVKSGRWGRQGRQGRSQGGEEGAEGREEGRQKGREASCRRHRHVRRLHEDQAGGRKGHRLRAGREEREASEGDAGHRGRPDEDRLLRHREVLHPRRDGGQDRDPGEQLRPAQDGRPGVRGHAAVCRGSGWLRSAADR